MIYDREVKRIYAGEYQRALRGGAPTDEAGARARRAVETHTDRPSTARGRPRDNPRPLPKLGRVGESWRGFFVCGAAIDSDSLWLSLYFVMRGDVVCALPRSETIFQSEMAKKIARIRARLISVEPACFDDAEAYGQFLAQPWHERRRMMGLPLGAGEYSKWDAFSLLVHPIG
jgi:hypothetical protein